MSAEEHLEEARRRIIAAQKAGERDLDLSDLEDLKELPVELGRLTSIKTLRFSNTRVSDLGIVSKLRHLTILEIDGTEVSDLAPLRGLDALSVFRADSCRITDLSPLGGLTDLEIISIGDNQVADIEPLSELHRLQLVFLDQTDVKGIRALSGLLELRSATLDSTPVEDISPLSNCTRLEWLSANYSSIRDFRPIRHLSSLIQDDELATGLAFFGTPVTRLDPKLETLSEIENDKERTQKNPSIISTRLRTIGRRYRRNTPISPTVWRLKSPRMAGPIWLPLPRPRRSGRIGSNAKRMIG